jgi:propanol-preferring alcohol dehydrogenase
VQVLPFGEGELLNDVQMETAEIAPLMCPGMAGYAAFKLTGVCEGDKLGLYGFGPTAYYVLKVAQSMGIGVYVSTRSPRNISSAEQEGAVWSGNAATERMPCKLDSAIIFPPAGNPVEPVLSQLEKGGALVMAPVSASKIVVENYSQNLWGRDIRTLYNLKRADAEEFIEMVDSLELSVGTSVFPFEELQDALILAKQGKLEQSNAVIRVFDRL